MKVGLIVVAFIGVVLLFQSFFVVDQTESAIVVQLGRPVRTITDPGLQMKIPFVQQVFFFDNRLLDYYSEPKDVITEDKKTLALDNYARWQITDSLLFYQSVRDENGAQSRLDDIIYSEVRVEVGTHIFEEILSKVRADLMKKVTRESNKKAGEYGIGIVDVRIKRADLPPENEKAVYSRMQAEREREAKRYRSEGEEEAQKVRSQAEREREILLAEAYKTSQEVMGRGDAEAFRLYGRAYSKDPEFFQFMRTMEAYKKTLNNTTTLVMSPDSEFLKYLKD